MHLFLLEKNFRLELKYFKTLLKYKANIILLTATLPNSLLTILENTLNIKGYTKVIRGISNREDISYIRLYFKKKEEELTILKDTIAKITKEDIDPRNKILIFINSKAKGEEISLELKVNFIYSKKDNLDTILKEFLESSSSRVLITTSILEVGLDLSNIKYTINLEPIFSLISIVQASGRIRNRGTSYIIGREPTKYKIDTIRQDTLLKNINLVVDINKFRELDRLYYSLFSIETKCLRIPISLFLDNTIIRCPTYSTNKCSLCLESSRILEEISSLEEEEARSNNYNLLLLEEKVVDYYSNYCFYCLVDPYYTSTYKHNILNCNRANNNKEYISLIKKIKITIEENNLIKVNIACFRCLLPKNLCTILISKYNIVENKCFIEDYIYFIIAIFYINKQVLKDILETISNLEDISFFIERLLTPTTIYNIETIKIVDIFNNLKIIELIRTLEDYYIREESILDINENSIVSSSKSSTTSLETNIDNTTIIRDDSILEEEEEELDPSSLDLDLPLPSPNSPNLEDSRLETSSLDIDLDIPLPSSNSPLTPRALAELERFNSITNPINYSSSLRNTFNNLSTSRDNTIIESSSSRKHYKNISLDTTNKDRGEGSSKKNRKYK